MENRLMIFISSLIGELANERYTAKEALQAISLIRPWVFEYTPASVDPLEESYLSKVRECDLFIMLLAQNISESVLKEWQTAIVAGKPRLVFLKKGEQSPEAQAFVKTIDVKWAEFATTEELKRQVQGAVTDELIKGYRRYRLKATDLSTLAEFAEKLAAGVTVGVAVGKDITQVVGPSYETRFYGEVHGPVLTGIGDIYVGGSRPTSEMVSAAELREVVFLSGVSEKGILEVPDIYLWDKPGGIAAGGRVVDYGVVKSGTPVEVLEKQEVNGRIFYKVRTYGAKAGKVGWVADSLVRKA
jgi:hypothetical protein